MIDYVLESVVSIPMPIRKTGQIIPEANEIAVNRLQKECHRIAVPDQPALLIDLIPGSYEEGRNVAGCGNVAGVGK
ncbi:MAG TPA: hypothetical protein PL001_07010 [Candidatus Kryptobacter bacterium]|nr:MAG: hypothetical protein B7Z63_00585 [Ignavibacteriae bacterium 37-53-5]HQT91762.1 hypothetical protein [Candidatus Kryptobacter bacterium]